MKKQIQDVRTFMQACDQPTPDEPIQKLDESIALLRIKLLVEEVEELAQAFGFDMNIYMDTQSYDPELYHEVEVIDALADITYVLYGAAVTCGHQDVLPEAFKRVQFSNMTKVVNGKCVKDSTGKVMKPASYIPPNLDNIFTEYEQGEFNL